VVNAPQSRRFSQFEGVRQSRSVWTARVFSTAFRLISVSSSASFSQSLFSGPVLRARMRTMTMRLRSFEFYGVFTPFISPRPKVMLSTTN
jgi:hypothetical protein